MGFEPAVVVLDANVLYPFHLRNIVVQAAADRLFEARWTDTIHDEWIRSLAASPHAVSLARLEATRELMEMALPTATVSDYEKHIAEINLPDPADRHVVAAGIAAAARIIVTWNVRHFPAGELRKFGLRKETPDSFLSGLYDRVPRLAIHSLANARRNLRKSKVSAAEFIGILKNQKLQRLAQRAAHNVCDL